MLPDDPKAGFLPRRVLPDDPKASFLPRRVLPDDPKASFLPPSVLPDDPKAGFLPPNVLPDDPKAGFLPLSVLPDDPKASFLPPSVLPDDPGPFPSSFSSLYIYNIMFARARGLLRQVEHDAVEVTSDCIDSTQRHRVCSRAAPHEFLTCLITCPVAVIFKDNTLIIIDYLDLAKLHA